MNEAVNDSTKLIAQSVEQLKQLHCAHCTQYPGVEEVVTLLEQALDKLLNCK